MRIETAGHPGPRQGIVADVRHAGTAVPVRPGHQRQESCVSPVGRRRQIVAEGDPLRRIVNQIHTRLVGGRPERNRDVGRNHDPLIPGHRLRVIHRMMIDDDHGHRARRFGMTPLGSKVTATANDQQHLPADIGGVVERLAGIINPARLVGNAVDTGLVNRVVRDDGGSAQAVQRRQGARPVRPCREVLLFPSRRLHSYARRRPKEFRGPAVARRARPDQPIRRLRTLESLLGAQAEPVVAVIPTIDVVGMDIGSRRIARELTSVVIRHRIETERMAQLVKRHRKEDG